MKKKTKSRKSKVKLNLPKKPSRRMSALATKALEAIFNPKVLP